MASETVVEVKREVMEVGEMEESEKSESAGLNGNECDVKEMEDSQLKANGDVDKDSRIIDPFKIQVDGLPKFCPLRDFKRLVKNDLGLALRYLKRPKKGTSCLHLTFSTAEDLEKAFKALHHYAFRQKTLSCSIISNHAEKRKQEDEAEGDNEAKKAKLDISIEKVLMVTLPYHNIPYEEQLRKKTEDFKAMIHHLGDLVIRQNPQLAGWAEQQKRKNNGLLFELQEIRPSPVVDAYRNKCKFRIGLNPDTQERTVGCRLENIKDGSVWVGPADSQKHLPDQMKEAVKLFQDYIRKSDKEPFSAETHQGYWRYLIVRISRNGDMMLTVVAHPQSLSDMELSELKNDLRDYFVNGEGNSCNVSSLYFQKFAEKMAGVPLPEMEHVHGKTHLEEPLLDLTFHLTPTSYFQVNTKGAEVLYSTIIELVDPSEETTVLDLCCGTGGIGLCLARKCGQVFGIENIPQNIEDAKYNSIQNNITNSEFILGRMEDVLPTLQDKITGKTVVPIIDPPRTAINKRILSQLRKYDNIKKLIYVCANHKNPTKIAPVRNFLDLCCAAGKHTMTGNPFVPVKAIPVDIVPHTMHAQMVILLERVDPETLPKTQNLLIRNSHKAVRGRGGRGAKSIPVVGRGVGRNINRGFVRGGSRNFVRGGRIQNLSMEIPTINMQRSVQERSRRMPLLPTTPPMRRTLLMTPPLRERHPTLLHSMRGGRSPVPLLDREIPPLLPSYGVGRRYHMDFSSDELPQNDFELDMEGTVDSLLGSRVMGYRRDGEPVNSYGRTAAMLDREEMGYRGGMSQGVGVAFSHPYMYSQLNQAAGRFEGPARHSNPGGKRGGISLLGHGGYRGRGGYR